MDQTIQTQRLVLRAPKATDVDAAIKFFMSDRAKAMGGPLDYGRAWRTFATECGHWAMLGYGMWIVTRRGDDTPIGMIGPWNPGDWPEKEIGWAIWEDDLEGTGLATEAAKAALDHAFATLGWDTAVSYVGVGNERSARLAEKLGAVRDDTAKQPEGKNVWVYRHSKPEATE